MVLDRLSLWVERSACLCERDGRLHESIRRREVLGSSGKYSYGLLVELPLNCSFGLELFVEIDLSWQSHKVQISNWFSYILRNIHLIGLVDLKAEVGSVCWFSCLSILVNHFHMQLHDSLIDLITESLPNDGWVLMSLFKHRILQCRDAFIILASV